MGFACVFNSNRTPDLLTGFTREVELVGGIELEATPGRKQRPGDGGDGAGAVRMGTVDVRGGMVVSDLGGRRGGESGRVGRRLAKRPL